MSSPITFSINYLTKNLVDSCIGLIRADFINFAECDSGITGRCLADKITGTLHSYGLDLINLRGQAYDGAVNMAGSIKDSLTDAMSLQLAIRTTDFIAPLAITSCSLKYIEALTTNLQAEAKDIVEAVRELTLLEAILRDITIVCLVLSSRCALTSVLCHMYHVDAVVKVMRIMCMLTLHQNIIADVYLSLFFTTCL
ncbi:52 kDa repressor of the inhibitor of the protein kinase-like [Oopsacas minuta]|uniref:52 kDa repressor of the inhibitor of the protein kinase-like n=1 Tax=Oopsacas minuta TaxID=111878 RepID=A0AAV7JX87_9METZ|nr:52 kDa repressor of the inhibitor of the protein kinase-like [Oopsacas minuta]